MPLSFSIRLNNNYDALRKSSYVNLSQCEVKRQASQCGLFLQGCQILRVESTMDDQIYITLSVATRDTYVHAAVVCVFLL